MKPKIEQKKQKQQINKSPYFESPQKKIYKSKNQEKQELKQENEATKKTGNQDFESSQYINVNGKKDQAQFQDQKQFKPIHKSQSQAQMNNQSNKNKSKNPNNNNGKKTQVLVVNGIKPQSKPIQQSKIKSKKLLQEKDRKQQAQKKQQQIENLRKKKLLQAKQLLQQKVSIIWIFVLQQKGYQEQCERIRRMYGGLQQNGQYSIPLCSKAEDILIFLNIKNSVFKIVSNLQNIEQCLEHSIKSNVLQFYIFNNQGEGGLQRAIQYKCRSKKVKGIFSDINIIIDRAQQEIQNEVRLYCSNNNIPTNKLLEKQTIFPTFIKLSREDKTNATLYRSNLYGALSIQKSQSEIISKQQQIQVQRHFKQFLKNVKEKYSSNRIYRKDIAEYEKIGIKDLKSLDRAKKVIEFYTRQSFYYKQLNTKLRTMKTPEEFKPCIFSFYQTYNSIKKFYELQLKNNQFMVRKQVVFRGGMLKQRQFKKLQKNHFIQILGFMSTSKDKDIAQKFMKRVQSNKCFFTITIPQLKIDQKYKSFDHGFIEINKCVNTGIQAKQQQILFNPLNIFKVTDLYEEDGTKYVQLQYGGIFGLLSKNRESLNQFDKEVLMNFQFCSKFLLQSIKDQGDVLLLASNFEEATKYYQKKIQENRSIQKQDNNIQFYYKLANVKQKCGQLKEANQYLQRSLNIWLGIQKTNIKENCMKVYSIHAKNADINQQQQDFVKAQQNQIKALQTVQQDFFQKARILMNLGQIKFKKGQIAQAQRYFNQSQQLLQLIMKNSIEEKSTQQKKCYYFLSKLFSTSHQKKIRQLQQKLKQYSCQKQKLKQLLFKISNALKSVALYVDNKIKYEKYVKKGRFYLQQMLANQSKDPMKQAELMLLKVSIQQSYVELVQSQKMLQQSIQLLQKSEPFDKKVGQFKKALANLQRRLHLQLENQNNQMGQKISFSDVKHKQIYEKCRKNYQDAINIANYNSTPQNQIILIRNQYADMQYCQSKLRESYRINKQTQRKYLEEKNIHSSEMAKSFLLSSKISLSRGQIKIGLIDIQKSIKILRKSMVKQQNSIYIELFNSSDLHLEIKLHKSKLYLVQLRQDLDLKLVEQILLKKTMKTGNHPLMADLLELKGQYQMIQIKARSHSSINFKNAIQLREKQFGCQNTANALTYCKYSRQLAESKQFKQAYTMIQKALNIFSKFQDTHPIFWQIQYSLGFYHWKKQQYIEAYKILEKSLKNIKRRYDPDHITVSKIKYLIANVMILQAQKQNNILLKQQAKTKLTILHKYLQKQIGKSINRIGQSSIVIDEIEPQYQNQVQNHNVMQNSGIQMMQSFNENIDGWNEKDDEKIRLTNFIQKCFKKMSLSVIKSRRLLSSDKQQTIEISGIP